MHRLPFAFVVSCLPFAVCSAHTGGEVDVTCPIDGTTFKSRADSSGTSFGARLDLKKRGPIAQPWALPQCPACRLPLYKDEFSDAEVARLTEIVRSERFRRETEDSTSYFALGVLFEELGSDAGAIGWTYLKASWQVEDEPERYWIVAGRAITWFDRSAALPASPDEDAETTVNRLVDRYLAIELSRRLGLFERAFERLEAMPPADESEIAWLPDAIALQRTLIVARDPTEHDLGEHPAIPEP